MFTTNTAIKTAVSDETGYFEFTEIPYGEYVICEIQAPEGYILSDKQYPVTINEDGNNVEITAENETITVEISKQDIYCVNLPRSAIARLRKVSLQLT